jgi:hypothetical protein
MLLLAVLSAAVFALAWAVQQVRSCSVVDRPSTNPTILTVDCRLAAFVGEHRTGCALYWCGGRPPRAR